MQLIIYIEAHKAAQSGHGDARIKDVSVSKCIISPPALPTVENPKKTKITALKQVKISELRKCQMASKEIQEQFL